MIHWHMTDTPEKLFWSRVVKLECGCWDWVGTRTAKGYGAFHVKGEYWRAHRYSWVLANGPIPNNLFVCHKCDMPSCVNPEHLFLGTNDDNMADMRLKGRSAGNGRGPRKLTAEQVVSARLRHPRESYGTLALEFGVSVETIRSAIRGFTWCSVNHLAPPGKGGSGGV